MRPRRFDETIAQRRRSQVFRDWLGTDLPKNPDRNVSRASEAIESIMDGLAFSEGMTEQDLKDRWREVVGGFIADHTSPDGLRRGVLKLRVLQPAMRYHLEQSKGALLKQLQEVMGADTVTRLEFAFG